MTRVARAIVGGVSEAVWLLFLTVMLMACVVSAILDLHEGRRARRGGVGG